MLDASFEMVKDGDYSTVTGELFEIKRSVQQTGHTSEQNTAVINSMNKNLFLESVSTK